ncbi:MAG TPA: hypothetical protein VGG57_10590 [Stellaceae bacterium]
MVAFPVSWRKGSTPKLAEILDNHDLGRMTPEDERDLFRRLRRIERLVSILLGVATLVAGMAAVAYLVPAVQRSWGISEFWAFLVVLAGLVFAARALTRE